MVKAQQGVNLNDFSDERCSRIKFRSDISHCSLCCFPPGSDRLPAGGAARSGEPQEGPGEADQDAGVRPQTGEVSHPQGAGIHRDTTFDPKNKIYFNPVLIKHGSITV